MIQHGGPPERDVGGAVRRRPRLVREGYDAFGAIVAIHSDGTIAKANVQARRLFGKDQRLEGQSLGSALGHLMSAQGVSSQRLHIRVRDDYGRERDVTLVLSDEEQSRPLRSQLQAQPEPAPDALIPPMVVPAAASAADFIAHELRNNLTITLGLSQVLESNFERMSLEDRLSALRGIQSEAHHALQVMQSLLSLVESRQHRGEATSAIPVHAVLRRVIAGHHAHNPERSIVVSGDEPVFAIGNSSWLQIAVANLVSNAERVTPPGRPIQINVHQAGDRVVVMVLDEGKPLTPAAYRGLWEIYLNGPPADVDISGSGIGLSLCKELVQAMGGRVWAGPRSEGGSAFAISLKSVAEDPTGFATVA